MNASNNKKITVAKNVTAASLAVLFSGNIFPHNKFNEDFIPIKFNRNSSNNDALPNNEKFILKSNTNQNLAYNKELLELTTRTNNMSTNSSIVQVQETAKSQNLSIPSEEIKNPLYSSTLLEQLPLGIDTLILNKNYIKNLSTNINSKNKFSNLQVNNYTNNNIISSSKINSSEKTGIYSDLVDNDRINYSNLNKNKSKNSSTNDIYLPKILVTKSTVFDLYSNITYNDILSVITAYDHNNKKIKNLKFTGKVNTSKPGLYNITFMAKNSNGNESSMQVPIIVSTQKSFISNKDIHPSISLNLETLNLDNDIKLKENINIATYNSGLLVPYNSTYIYDISDKNFTYFESFLGIDINDKFDTTSIVVFEIWVDNVLKFNSEKMNLNSNMQYVKIDITNAKEIKLVTKGNSISLSNFPAWADIKFISTKLNNLENYADIPSAKILETCIDSNNNYLVNKNISYLNKDTVDTKENTNNNTLNTNQKNSKTRPLGVNITERTTTTIGVNIAISLAITGFSLLGIIKLRKNNK